MCMKYDIIGKHIFLCMENDMGGKKIARAACPNEHISKIA